MNIPMIQYYDSGEIKLIEWYKKDITGTYRHKDNGPAYISYYIDGTVSHYSWYNNGKLFNEYGPISVHFNKDHKIESIFWSNDLRKSSEIEHWIKHNNIELDDNLNIKNTNDRIFYKLNWL